MMISMSHLIAKILLSLGLVTVFTWIGCSKDKPTAPSRRAVYARDYIHFPDSNVVIHLAIRCLPELSTQGEPFLEQEAVIGEPFIDINDNGTYESAVDSFLISSDPNINQDLNFNGRYDGPNGFYNGDYDKRIPWDDIDGNGERRSDTHSQYVDSDTRYAPFRDWNSNGTWDSLTSVAEDFFYFMRVESLGTAYYPRQTSGFTYGYLSDSGITYSAPINGWGTLPSTGVHIGPDSVVGVLWGGVGTLFFADTSEIVADAGTVRIMKASLDTTYITRKVVLDTSLELNGTHFGHLLWFRFDSIRTAGGIDPWRSQYYWEFFFDRKIGLLAHGMYGYWVPGPHMFYFNELWAGDSTLPLIKTPRP